MAEILWHKLEDNAANTTVVDNANNSLTGTSSVDTSDLSVAGKVGLGFNFVAASNHTVTRASSTLLDFARTGFSIALWINPDTVDTASLFSKGDLADSGYIFITVATIDALGLYIGSQLHTSSASSISAASWQHVVATYDKDTNEVKFYIDGVLDSAVNQGTTLVDDASTVAIGSHAGAFFFDGKLDDIRVFDRPLTLEEAQFLYNSASGTAVPLDASVTQLTKKASKVAVDAATASGANSAITTNNKTVLGFTGGQNIQVVALTRLATSPA